jgi:succinate dehydrogenase flavin-adding protein (antitoxin of CptAB toxin-antitoxin module)
MRELDVLLARFIDTTYADLGAAERDLFDRLLDESDVDLHAWLTRREVPGKSEFARLVQLITRTGGN